MRPPSQRVRASARMGGRAMVGRGSTLSLGHAGGAALGLFALPDWRHISDRPVRPELVEGLLARSALASTSLYGLAPINQPVRKGEEPGWRDIDRHRQLLQTQPTDTLSHHPIPAPSVDKEPGDGTA